jgi:lysophospholipase L1-like esterase
VVRNYGGLNTSHAAGAPVTETDAIHLNAQGYQVVANAVAQYLYAYKKQTP